MSTVHELEQRIKVLESLLGRGVDHLSVDSDGHLKINTGIIADSFNGYILDFNTNNTIDTWVPVFRGNILQHRVIPRDIITTKQVQVLIDRAYGGNVDLTAPTVTGYTFVAWVAVASDGWVGSCYVENATAATSRIWNASTGQGGNGAVVATALYKANF